MSQGDAVNYQRRKHNLAGETPHSLYHILWRLMGGKLRAVYEAKQDDDQPNRQHPKENGKIQDLLLMFGSFSSPAHIF
jgi:hypothetical protein